MLNTEDKQYLSTGQKIDVHNGEFFDSIASAEETCKDWVKDGLCTRFAIGSFMIDNYGKHGKISILETFGFKHDKSRVEQLNIFK